MARAEVLSNVNEHIGSSNDINRLFMIFLSSFNTNTQLSTGCVNYAWLPVVGFWFIALNVLFNNLDLKTSLDMIILASFI